MLRTVSRAVGRKGTVVCLSCSLTALLIGCVAKEESGDDMPEAKVGITAQGAALTVQENVDAALRGTLKAAAFVAESQALASSLSSLQGSSEDCVTTGAASVCTVDANGVETCAPSEPSVTTCTSTTEEVTTEDLQESHQEMVDALDDFMTFLKDEIFIDANLESEADNVVIYKLPASVVCSDESSGDSVSVVSGTDPATGDVAPIEEPIAPVETGPDPECLEQFEKLQPRLRLSSPKEGDIDVAVLLTAEKTNPVTLQLYSDRVGLVVDLGELKATLDAAGEDTAELHELDGKVSTELIRNGANDYSIRGSVLEDVHVVAGEEGEVVTVVLTSTEPTTELRLDGNKKTITGTLNYGALNVTGPLAAFADEETYDEEGNPVPHTYTGTIDAVLGGLNGSLEFDGSTDVLNFKNIGLGDVSTSVAFDGEDIFKLDVNKDDERRFDLSVAKGEGDTATLTFTPTLDVRLLLNFASLATQITDLDHTLLNDNLHLWFDGANPSIEVGGDNLRVVSGTLHIDSEVHPESSVTVDPGMCLVESESDAEVEAEPETFAAALAAGVCE